jgi:hypothetical protein
VSKLKPAENLRDGNSAGPVAGVELHSDQLAIAPDAGLQADRGRVAAIDNRPVAFEKQVTPLAARHDRPLALIEDEYRQFRLLNFALTGTGDDEPTAQRLGQKPSLQPAFRQGMGHTGSLPPAQAASMQASMDNSAGV